MKAIQTERSSARTPGRRNVALVSFRVLFDADLFERKLGTLDLAIRNTQLTDEKKQAICTTFENLELLTAPKEDVKGVNTKQSI